MILVGEPGNHDIGGRSGIPRVPAPNLIDLSRAVPPPLPEIEGALGRVIADRLRDEGSRLLRTNRTGGSDEDRAAGAKWMAQRLDEVPEQSRMLVSNGTLNILFMLTTHLAGRGGTVFAEAMTYPHLRALADIVGFRLYGLPIDEHGLIPDTLDVACQKLPGRKVLYTIPTLQNPTTAIMPADRREAVAAVARTHGLAIIEDDAQAHMPECAPPPVAKFAPELTWFVMGLAKSLAMGVRIAFLAAPSADDAAELMKRFGKMSTWFPAALQAELMLALMTEGLAYKAARSIRTIAIARRELLAQALGRPELAAKPAALHLWLPVEGDAAEIAMRAQAAGVLVRPGFQFACDGLASIAAQGLRISYCECASADDVRRGGAILAEILNR